MTPVVLLAVSGQREKAKRKGEDRVTSVTEKERERATEREREKHTL